MSRAYGHGSEGAAGLSVPTMGASSPTMEGVVSLYTAGKVSPGV